jgi:hypothetical protein
MVPAGGSEEPLSFLVGAAARRRSGRGGFTASPALLEAIVAELVRSGFSVIDQLRGTQGMVPLT